MKRSTLLRKKMDRVFFLQLLLNTPPPYSKCKSIFESRGLDLRCLVAYQLFQAQFNSLLCKNVISEVGYGRSRGEVRIEGDVYEEVDFVFPPNGRMNIFKASQNIKTHFPYPNLRSPCYKTTHRYKTRFYQPPARHCHVLLSVPFFHVSREIKFERTLPPSSCHINLQTELLDFGLE